jgi:hypothetical protein
VVVDPAGNGVISIAWDAPLSDGGSAIANYKIYRKTNNLRDSYALISVWPSSNKKSFSDSPLLSGTLYLYEVTAVNTIGESVFSNAVSSAP